MIQFDEPVPKHYASMCREDQDAWREKHMIRDRLPVVSDRLQKAADNAKAAIDLAMFPMPENTPREKLIKLADQFLARGNFLQLRKP